MAKFETCWAETEATLREFLSLRALAWDEWGWDASKLLVVIEDHRRQKRMKWLAGCLFTLAFFIVLCG